MSADSGRKSARDERTDAPFVIYESEIDEIDRLIRDILDVKVTFRVESSWQMATEAVANMRSAAIRIRSVLDEIARR